VAQIEGAVVPIVGKVGVVVHLDGVAGPITLHLDAVADRLRRGWGAACDRGGSTLVVLTRARETLVARHRTIFWLAAGNFASSRAGALVSGRAGAVPRRVVGRAVVETGRRIVGGRRVVEGRVAIIGGVETRRG